MFNDYKQLLENTSNQYDKYLKDHIGNVQKAYEWLKQNLPEILDEYNYADEKLYYGDLDSIIKKHDKSKYIKVPDYDNYFDLPVEYDAYADYFYGELTPEVTDKFNKAWLSHIHSNPHHWQHWILINDEDESKILDIPYVFIIEMICDWWAFSWKSGNLYSIFDWYDNHKSKIILSKRTRNKVESILTQIRKKLDEVNSNAK